MAGAPIYVAFYFCFVLCAMGMYADALLVELQNIKEELGDLNQSR